MVDEYTKTPYNIRKAMIEKSNIIAQTTEKVSLAESYLFRLCEVRSGAVVAKKSSHKRLVSLSTKRDNLYIYRLIRVETRHITPLSGICLFLCASYIIIVILAFSRERV